MNIDWDNAPEGATHVATYRDPSGLLVFYKQQDGKKWFDVKNQEWSYVGGKPNFDLIERPKPLTQAVFDGLPPEYLWAAVDEDGETYAHAVKPECHFYSGRWVQPIIRGSLALFGGDHDTTDWQNSLIERQDVSSRVEQLRSVEAARKHSHYFKDVSGVDKIDVYAVLRLFEVTDPCLQHIVKKALCAGKRGAKDWAKDVQEIADTAQRLIELESAK